jgi:hypothetical protein
VLNDEELISAIFYLAGGRVRGSTRLQKVVFLVERVLGLGALGSSRGGTALGRGSSRSSSRSLREGAC